MAATLKDIAEKLGVSISTVSLVLNNKKGVGSELRAQVLKIARELKYPIPMNEIKEKDEIKATYKIHFLFEKLKGLPFADIFYGEILQGLEEGVRLHDYSISFTLIANNEDHADLISKLLSTDIDGLIAIGGGAINDKLLESIKKEISKPILLLDNFVIGKKYNCVLADNINGGYKATRYLIENGHRNIGVIKGPKYYKSLTERFEGFLEAMDEFGLPVKREWIVQTDHAEYKKGYFEMNQILSLPERPTAIFAVSDKTAFGAMDAITQSGLKIPEDISIVGFDDVYEAGLTVPRLTTIRVPKKNMGILAIERIRNLIEKENSIPLKMMLYTDLVIRETVGQKT